MDGCDINMDGCEFYYVDALVPVSNSTERLSMDVVIEKPRATLFEHKFELSEVLLCTKFSPVEWVGQTKSVGSSHNLALRASETNSVVCGGFRSEEVQRLYRYKYSVSQLLI